MPSTLHRTLRQRWAAPRNRNWFVSTNEQLRQARQARAGDTIYLQRGTRFREELTGLRVGVKVRAFGEGARPIIDGRDIADNIDFIKTPGRTNVYEIAWMYGFAADGGKSLHRVWEDDLMMTRASSIANCDSTPGSFFANAPTTGGPDLVYVHPAGSTSPVTNGREYALTKRRWCVQLYQQYNQADVAGIEAIGNSYADGAICVDGYIEDCVVRDGRYHNFFVLGEAVNCQAIGIEGGAGSLYVSYYDSGPTFGGPSTRDVIYRRCTADSQVPGAAAQAFLVHTNYSGRVFGTIQFEECHATRCSSGFTGDQMQRAVCYRCTYEDVHTAYGFGATQTVVLLGGSGTTAAAFNTKVVDYTLGNTVLIVRGLKSRNTFGAHIPLNINAAGSSIDISRCTFVGANGGSTLFAAGNVKLRGVVITGNNLNNGTIGTAGAQIEGFDSDNNCFWSSNYSEAQLTKLFGGNVPFFTIANWRAYLNSVNLGIGKDSNSIAADPQVAMDFTIGNTAVLALGAGAAPDDEDDPELQALWEQYRVQL